jgi:hypothetical protein
MVNQSEEHLDELMEQLSEDGKKEYEIGKATGFFRFFSEDAEVFNAWIKKHGGTVQSRPCRFKFFACFENGRVVEIDHNTSKCASLAEAVQLAQRVLPPQLSDLHRHVPESFVDAFCVQELDADGNFVDDKFIRVTVIKCPGKSPVNVWKN